jgi:hypothetical protein
MMPREEVSSRDSRTDSSFQRAVQDAGIVPLSCIRETSRLLLTHLSLVSSSVCSRRAGLGRLCSGGAIRSRKCHHAEPSRAERPDWPAGETHQRAASVTQSAFLFGGASTPRAPAAATRHLLSSGISFSDSSAGPTSTPCRPRGTLRGCGIHWWHIARATWTNPF